MVLGDRRKPQRSGDGRMRGIIAHDHFEPKRTLKIDHMKRTRRIEITRYRRRVTVSQGEPSAAELAEERREGDLILNVLQSIPPMADEADRSALVVKEAEAEYPLQRRSLLRLGNLLRLRKGR